ncbi:MAG: patatin-like phospholipase family protein [Planctomycetes bacterium]|nr:patatin-like phospholipase family protein [Planctomycetota bacterium]
MFEGKKVSLVLGGGGIRGLAHVGVLKVLARNGIIPDEYVGCSGGSIVAAMAAGGMMPEEIEWMALRLRRQDVLDYNWWNLLWRRGRARSIYRGKALHDTVRRRLPVDRWNDLVKPLYINTVDLNSGQEVVFGMPGMTDVPVHDVVVASCAIPGVFPPKEIGRRFYVDGGVLDVLPVKVAIYNGAGLIIAVNLERDTGAPLRGVEKKGMVAIIDQAHTIIARTLSRLDMKHFQGAPVVLIEPPVENHGIFQFERTQEVILAGERAAERVIFENPMLKAAVRQTDHTPLPGTVPVRERPNETQVAT